MKLIKSPNPKKKWRALFDDGTHTDFGAAGYEDYTQHHDKARRDNYRRRHAGDLMTKDPKRAGFLSMFILWGESTSLEENLRRYKSKFNL